jgi:hypothetical protein
MDVFYLLLLSIYHFLNAQVPVGILWDLSSNRSSWAGVLWFHLTSMMTILVVPLSGQELF